MAYETIIVEIEDHVALVKLNRPDAMNALNLQVFEELGDFLSSAQTNDKVRCIVLTGTDKFFAAGADIKMMSEMTSSPRISSGKAAPRFSATASR